MIAVENLHLKNWIETISKLTKPSKLHVYLGTTQEYNSICSELVAKGVIEPLNPIKRPNSFLARTDPNDVARTEKNTFICCENKVDAGPTNNWCPPKEMREKLLKLFAGCMEGRTMYIIPFSMGPIDSPLSKIGIEITDSAYVVINMHLMARTGQHVLDKLGLEDTFVKCLHSVGAPLLPGQVDVSWPCNIENRHIVQFPETTEIWSFGSGYGGNSLLGKKCFALRIASTMGKREGWLAEHMLILGLQCPDGKKHYIAASFPSACGKTNLAMLQSTLPNYKVTVVGDDIAWMRFGDDGRLYAINPEFGFFGVAPGTSKKTNENAIDTLSKNCIFTNVAKTEDGDVWWEGMTNEIPTGKIIDWLGKEWNKSKGTPAAHPNSRFTVGIQQCPVLDNNWDNPTGVPISAIIFGGRRPSTVPLVFEALNWAHGVLIGSTVCSQKTAAAEGKVGELRFDPFSMLPFCGYNMGDYFRHWLSLERPNRKMPKVFHVNWFRRDPKTGEFLWPGFGENIRVLKWIVDRIENNPLGTRSKEDFLAIETPIGFLPRSLSVLDTSPGLKGPIAKDWKELDKFSKLLQIDRQSYLEEIDRIKVHYAKFGDHLPEELTHILLVIEKKLKDFSPKLDSVVKSPLKQKKLTQLAENVKIGIF